MRANRSATDFHAAGAELLACCMLMLGVFLFESSGAVAQTADSIAITHHTEWARMRDGVLLASEVYQPKDSHARLPVVLIRSPYDGGSPKLDAWMQNFVSQGYVLIIQDCRGTGRSHGVLRPFVQEQPDGYDAVEWAAAQPWSNGKVGVWGASYMGITVMQAASAHPPHLVAAVAGVTASDYHDNWTYANGVFDLWFGQVWASWADNDSFRRQLLRSGTPWALVQERSKEHATQSEQTLPKWLKVVPLNGLRKFESNAPFYYEWLAHPFYDRYWSAVDLEGRYADTNVPVLFIGGWYDIFP